MHCIVYITYFTSANGHRLMVYRVLTYACFAFVIKYIYITSHSLPFPSHCTYITTYVTILHNLRSSRTT